MPTLGAAEWLPTRGTPDYVLWRDIKVDGQYAFIVSEISASGLQVFDLRRLLTAPKSTPTVFTSNVAYGEFGFAHNISINEATDVAYVVGSNTCGVNGENGGLHMVDLSEPLAPRFAGSATVDTFTGAEPNNYVHDVECVVYRGPDADYRGRELFGDELDERATANTRRRASSTPPTSTPWRPQSRSSRPRPHRPQPVRPRQPHLPVQLHGGLAHPAVRRRVAERGPAG